MEQKSYFIMNNLFNDIEILILVGGQGTRLKSVINDLPKPMAPIGQTPFLEIQIRQIMKFGFKNFRLLTGYQAQKIENYFKLNPITGANISFTVEETPLGTGGAIANGIKESPFDQFIIFNGDTYFDFDLLDFFMASRENLKSGLFTICLNYIKDSTRYGFVEVDNDLTITNFHEKPIEPKSGYINSGVYVFNKNLLEQITQKKFSIEADLFPTLTQKKLLKGNFKSGTFIDIGIPEDYLLAQSVLKGVQGT